MRKIFSFLLILALLLSISIPASATDKDIFVELSDDKTYLYIKDAKDLSAVKIDYSSVEEVYFDNCTVKKDEEIFKSNKIKHVVFNNCVFEDEEINLSENVEIFYFYETLPEDLSFLKRSKTLREIVVNECYLEDLSKFSHMGKAERVRFVGCYIGKISGIEKGNEIEELSFNRIPIESIEELRYVKGLRYLDLTCSGVYDLSPIKDLDLVALDISDCFRIRNPEIIMEIDTLETLISYNCQMYYTPEMIEYLNKNKISSLYKKGDLELKEKVLDRCEKIKKQYQTDEERIGATVKFACDMITYDYEVAVNDDLSFEYGENIIKSAFEYTGCCTTYAGLVAMMLNEMGIDCYSISANNHIWNLVKLDGHAYWLDATWVDTDGVDYLDESENFMVTDKDFEASHPGCIVPPSVHNNPDSFKGVFRCKTRFKIEDNLYYFQEHPTLPTPVFEEVTEDVTEEKITEIEETTSAEKTEKETTLKEETTKPDENQEKNKDNNGNIVKLFSVLIVLAIVVAVVSVVIIKKKKSKKTEKSYSQEG